MKPKLSLVTGSINRPEALSRMVRSIEAHTRVEWELVISDASGVPYGSINPRVHVIHEKPRLGHSKGYNVAFRRCEGEFILWLNDDAEVCPGYDTESIAFMESHPRIGLGALHYSEPENRIEFHVNDAWDCIYANFGIFRKSLGEQIGFFDEEIRMYGADNSIALRVLLADYGIADIPKARIIHHSVNDAIRAENQIGRLRDNEILTRKYMPLQGQWVAAFRRHRVETGTIPWSHGRQPQTVRR